MLLCRIHLLSTPDAGAITVNVKTKQRRNETSNAILFCLVQLDVVPLVRHIANVGYVHSKHIQFSILTSREIVALSQFEATQRDLYKLEDRSPVQNGVLDRRLGASDKMKSCDTCGLALADCVGHYAYIKLVLPVFHIGYFKHCLGILHSICKVTYSVSYVSSSN